MTPVPIPTIFAELALLNPKLVLMRGDQYFHIRDLSDHARRDAVSGTAQEKAVLSEPIYWYTTDERGKILVKGVRDQGGEFVTFVEAGSSAKTAFD